MKSDMALMTKSLNCYNDTMSRRGPDKEVKGCSQIGI